MDCKFRLEHFDAGTTIFNEGDESTCAYLVESGLVAITKSVNQEAMLLDNLRPGAIFGEMGIISNQPRTATATAQSMCALVVIDRPILESMLGRAPFSIQSLLRSLIERLRGANDRMVSGLTQEHAGEYLGVNDFAERTGITPDDVLSRIASGEIPRSCVFVNALSVKQCSP